MPRKYDGLACGRAVGSTDQQRLHSTITLQKLRSRQLHSSRLLRLKPTKYPPFIMYVDRLVPGGNPDRALYF